MAKKSSKSKKTQPRKTKAISVSKGSGLWGLEKRSLLEQHMTTPIPKNRDKTATVVVSADKSSGPPQRVHEDDNGVSIQLFPFNAIEHELDPKLQTSEFTRMRDAVGGVIGALDRHDVGQVEFQFDLNHEMTLAAILGLEIALYRFKRVLKRDEPTMRISIKNGGEKLALKEFSSALAMGQAVNLARHLTNLPPNLLNPNSYALAMRQWFGSAAGIKFEIWDEKRLSKEQMNLHVAVGAGSRTQARLIRVQYRPRGAKGAPIALVGKGITFDTGGLDIKPAAAMRLMKKDMGGSATVMGVLDWAVRTKLAVPIDVYAPLAENSIGDQAFRPSDVLVSRSGQSVEIHNTDAEGRLVLADSLSLAVEQKQKPRFLIDVATLTGAIKVALGSHIGGLFGTDADLIQALATSGQQVGDILWPMPLYQKYKSHMNSTFADMINAPDGFGGAITAALFLQKFVEDVPWAHLDIYAWKDSSDGAWLEAGGSGQGVLGLAHWLQELSGSPA